MNLIILALAASLVSGRVTADGSPLKGVVVSDGHQTVVTDWRGRYRMRSDMPEGYVFSNSGNAVFYVGEYYYSRSGLGVYYDRYGNVVYAGDFKDDYPTEKYPMSGFDNYKFECKEYSGGNYFVGMTKEGKPDGLGFYIWSNGNLWFGEWENGERNGYGIHMSYEGKITTGEWKDGKKQ